MAIYTGIVETAYVRFVPHSGRTSLEVHDDPPGRTTIPAIEGPVRGPVGRSFAPPSFSSSVPPVTHPDYRIRLFSPRFRPWTCRTSSTKNRDSFPSADSSTGTRPAFSTLFCTSLTGAAFMRASRRRDTSVRTKSFTCCVGIVDFGR